MSPHSLPAFLSLSLSLSLCVTVCLNHCFRCAKEDGVEAHYYIDEKTPTGTCAVLVNSGDRSLVANLAAANNFVPAHLETERAKAMVGSARFYYIASFFLTVSVDSILQIAKPAAASGKVGVGESVSC